MNQKQQTNRIQSAAAKIAETFHSLGQGLFTIVRAIAPTAMILAALAACFYVTRGAGRTLRLDEVTSTATAAFLTVSLLLSYGAMSRARKSDDVFDSLVFSVLFGVVVILFGAMSVLFYSKVSLSNDLVIAAQGIYSFVVPLLVLMGVVSVAMTEAIDITAKPGTANEVVSMLALPVVCILVVIYSSANALAFGQTHGVNIISVLAACLTVELLFVGSAARAITQMKKVQEGEELDWFDLSARVFSFLASGAYLAAISIATVNPAGMAPETLTTIVSAYSAAPIVAGFGLLLTEVAPKYINITSNTLRGSGASIPRLAGLIVFVAVGAQFSLIGAILMAVIGLFTGSIGYDLIKTRREALAALAQQPAQPINNRLGGGGSFPIPK